MTKKVYKQEHFPLSQLRIQTGKFLVRIELLLKYKMGWKMENFNIFGIHRKIWVLEWGVMESQYIGEDCLKGGPGQLDLRGGGLGKKKGGWYPEAHYALVISFLFWIE